MSELETYRKAGFEPKGQRHFEDDDEAGLSGRADGRPVSARAPAAPQPSLPLAKAPAADKTPAPPPADAANGQEVIKGEAEPPKPKGGRRHAILVAVLLAGISAGAYYGYHWWTEGRFLVSTDDAYVKADMSVIAAKAAGYVDKVPVADNQQVRAGDLLAKVDDRDYRIAVEAARRKLASQDATIARLREQASAQIEQAKAQVVSAQAGLTRAIADFERANTLAAREYGSKQTLDQARAARDQAQAGVASAQAAQRLAEATLAVLNAQVEEAVHVRAELQTSLDQANLSLSYTEVRAPFDGVVGNKAVQRGQYVQTGTRLLSLVPLDTVYVEANYKETQLADIRPGEKVDVAVDAADGRRFEGVVESIAPASGSQFSLLPPENATGNFTKIVQRVPVRIRVSGEAVKAGVLRPGLSVVTYIHTRAGDRQQAARQSAGGAQAAPAN